jgi:hypothetical protein
LEGGDVDGPSAPLGVNRGARSAENGQTKKRPRHEGNGDGRGLGRRVGKGWRRAGLGFGSGES